MKAALVPEARPGMTAVFGQDTNIFNDLTGIFVDSESRLPMFSMT
jgi:hypothetical protein